MREVTQTILAGRDDGVYGNCLQACVASILELPIDAVPHFAQFDDWRAAIRLFLAGRDMELRCWGAERAEVVPTYEPLMVAGKSPRLVNGTHVVVWQDGQMIFDVHPSRDGIVGEPIEYYQLVPLRK